MCTLREVYTLARKYTQEAMEINKRFLLSKAGVSVGKGGLTDLTLTLLPLGLEQVLTKTQSPEADHLGGIASLVPEG